MAFLGMVFNYMLRVNINLTVVAMVKVEANSSQANGSAQEVCGFTDDSDHENDEEGEFEWDEFTQSVITSSFFWGYIWTPPPPQVPGGRIAEVFGARRVFGGALTAASLITLITPISARNNAVPLIVTRVLLGIAEGRRRAPWWATAVVCPHHLAGWRWVFYVQAGMALVWCLAWFLVVADSPHVDTRITKAERDYIVAAIGDTKKRKAPPVPVRSALSSVPFWAILLSNMGSNWGFYTLLTELPLYMKNMLVQDIKSNATLSALPYLGMWIFSLVVSKVGDTLIKKEIASTTIVRKTANTILLYIKMSAPSRKGVSSRKGMKLKSLSLQEKVKVLARMDAGASMRAICAEFDIKSSTFCPFTAQVGPAVCLLAITLVQCNRVATIALFFVAVTFQGGIYTGFMVNHIDIAPNFAGTLFGITNAFATIPSWVGPMTTGALTKGQQNFEQWNKVFYIASGVYIANACFYLVFASGEVQPWNQVREPEKQDKERRDTVAKSVTSNPAYDAYVVTPHATAYVNTAFHHK
ncbi:putative inorganic phosphate cotransporter [Chionoecetes opilio]|uniref:Putative inorganic phosphate cotransporter n=1 Tax=Chionoecetes opilio TaxID=41210 RepID=A0A8J4Y4A4_CHIOP|nr:putative inorganic phosphate cotransporter [Chionoecetes opilio]